ncbi:polysaccharide deacetylase family protein [Dokdonella fugitiva]|jgi:peptidoglycan/xylan/chitin deacetylase (PgdA/CDA1 family)|uniref:Polysaccharide deacetylase n=1 Tax=Dokdonella fugitiva TaxID=328517 RepID=A0A4R2IBL1_9GAMM|nr:polysaccharide deacetylase family protein [Dokdonella fugitiva]MBA8884821.1 peptidoglycan/xylan/chitin deacetylase (PgdA/CDA1 family) [Dokdonella fugitiva]TCO40838.1 polysaccharide deacetylase [Dokdonella fugitiva]
MRVPVLAYHSNNVSGNDYADNDHVALATDLRLLARLGLRVVPLATVVDVLLGDAPASAVEGAVALSFDDGSWFDWHDIDHPTWGPQRGFAGILRDFAAESGAPVHATSFVIVSPQARATLDRTCLAGRGWWGDEWWRPAQAEGLLAIESHGWDHNHPTLPGATDRAGTFRTIDDYDAADAQIRQAADWLDAFLAPRRSRLFAYPYGETNDYLLREYLPGHAGRHRLRAAFGTEAAPVSPGAHRWNLPRYIAGAHWKSPGELERLLAG